MKLVIFPVSARQFGIKDMLELKTFWGGNRMGGYTSWFEAYFVTLIDRCSFLCVSGQRGTIAKSMHEEHLCVVLALTSNGARNPVLSACLLPPCCVVAYYSSSTFR